MTPTSPVNPSFCGSLYQTGASSVDWLGKQAKTLSASAGETLGRVWSSVSTFFASIAATIGQWMNTAKEGLLAAKDQIVALPRETKIVGAIGLTAVAVTSWVASSMWNKSPAVAAAAAAQPAVAAAAAQLAAGAAAQHPAAAAPQPAAAAQLAAGAAAQQPAAAAQQPAAAQLAAAQ